MNFLTNFAAAIPEWFWKALLIMIIFVALVIFLMSKVTVNGEIITTPSGFPGSASPPSILSWVWDWLISD